jgi:hypothetical protein
MDNVSQGEVLDDQLGRGRGDAAAGLRPTAQRVLADVRERLIFRAQTHIRDEVRRRPSPTLHFSS